MAAAVAQQVVAPFQVLARPWEELGENLVQMMWNLEDSGQGCFPKDQALVFEKEALMGLMPLLGEAVLPLETAFQTPLSAELVERLAEMLLDVADSATRDFLGRKRTLAGLLVQVASTGTVEPVFPPAAFQVANLALEETLERRASAGAGIVE